MQLYCTKIKMPSNFEGSRYFLQLQHLIVTDFDRLISDQRLKSFYSTKLYFKSEPFDLKSTAMIDYCINLHHYLTAENPSLILSPSKTTYNSATNELP
jgi:hypothetical protein